MSSSSSSLVVSLFLATSFAALAAGAGCGGGQPQGKWAQRAEGCEVAISNDAPGVMSENIGPVSATCAMDVSDSDCLRTLKDQVCKLGGDLVWGVEPSPRIANGKKQFSGRAAHTQTQAPGK